MGLGALLGLFTGGSAPKTSTAPIQQTEEEKRKSKKSRAALYETPGGATGQELAPGQVQKRETLMGN